MDLALYDTKLQTDILTAISKNKRYDFADYFLLTIVLPIALLKQ